MRLSTRVFFRVLVSASGLARAAQADDAAPIDFSLEYRAAEGCPNASSFESALQARLPAARRLATSESRERIPSLRVELRAAGDPENSEIIGNLPDGTSFRRAVAGAACVDVMQSMAVIAAMALENNRRRATSASPSVPTSAPPQEEVATSEPAPATPAAAHPVARPVQHATPSSRSAPGSHASWRGSSLASVGIEGGVAPDIAPAFALGLELADSARSGLSPSVRLSGLLAQSLTKRVGSADVRFRLLAARLDLCPARARRWGLAATACVELDLGQLRGSAEHVQNSRSQRMLWLGFGLLGRAQVELTPHLAIELSAGARALPVHDHFVVNPAPPIFEVPVIAGDLLVGLAYSWP